MQRIVVTLTCLILLETGAAPSLGVANAADVSVGDRSDSGISTTVHNPFPIVSFKYTVPDRDGRYSPPMLSSFWTASASEDESGLPVFVGAKNERFYNVSSVAFAAIGVPSSYPELNFAKLYKNKTNLTAKQLAAFKWLDAHKVVLPNGAITWHYQFPMNYNNIEIEAGWPSAFAQAAVIQAYIVAYEITQDDRYLNTAYLAARAYLVSADAGGLTSQVAGLPFFEEIPLPGGESPHVLNGHLYSIVSLHELQIRRPDAELADLAKRARQLTKLTIPEFDQGYWTRYDLVPRFVDIPLKFESNDLDTKIKSLQIHRSGERTYVIAPSLSSKGHRSLFYGAGWKEQKEGLHLGDGGAFLQFTLDPADKSNPFKKIWIKVDLDGDIAPPRLSVLGFRQRVKEYFPLQLDTVSHIGGMTSATYRLDVKDLQWSDLQRYYVEWHQRLMAAISKIDPDPVFEVTAFRWQSYLDNQGALLSSRLQEIAEGIFKGGADPEHAAKLIVNPQIPNTKARIADANFEPLSDRQIVRKLGPKMASLSCGRAVERLISNAAQTGQRYWPQLLKEVRRLGIESNLYSFGASSVGRTRHFLDAKCGVQQVSFDLDRAVEFQVGGKPVNLRTAIATVFSGSPPVPAVAGKVAADPDQLQIVPLSDAPSNYVLPVLKSASDLSRYIDEKIDGPQPAALETVDSTGAKIVSSTPFYEGHGPEKVLNPREGDYAAAREGIAINSFTLEMPRAIKGTSLQIVWNSANDYPKEIRLFGIDGPHEALIGSVSNNIPKNGITNIPLISDKLYQRFRIEASEFVGQSRFIATKLRLVGLAPAT